MTLQRQNVAKKADDLVLPGGGEVAERKIVKRRRPGDSQREQKELTRRKLLEAAQVVFSHHTYSDTAVEMVADQAGVSRTTFYRHFDGKLPLALALFEEMVPRLQNTWRQLFELSEPTTAQVTLWLENLIKESSMSQVLVSVFSQIEATEPDAQANKYRYYHEIWKLSGIDDQVSSKKRESIRSTFLLTMLQIDQFLYLVCARSLPIGEASLKGAMAEIVCNFLAEARASEK